ncbi:proton-coupled amino acid transporter-like protein CG1139 [Ostrinia furnacalis]|uniref:proton-coupled amino acid transporter-like protein CG1139 n=1 Tax=Ostrinia furnacalis TaxID=93504 RepID=UPI0010403B45|nr:proton-coupled amino acid transporter-like protein CG1139 [Ostrinia furnacalis]
MFIYTFMAGIVDTITGGDDEQNYDPHTHRKVERPTSYMDTMIHLLKGSIGAGILAMPDAMSRMGIVFGIVGVVFIAVFATYCIQLLIAAQYELCKRWRRGYMAYPKSMRLALQDGPPCLRWAARPFYYFVDVVLILWQLGICCIYLIFVAENVKQVCDFNDVVFSIRIHIAFQLGPQLLLNLIKNLKLLTPLSTISNVVTILGLILVFFYLIEDDVVLSKEMLEIKRWEDIPVFIGITLFALEAVGVVLALEYNMEHPKQFVGLVGLFNVGMLIIMSMYALVGVFGYLKYGHSIKASLTLNLPHEQKKAQAAKITLALAIFLSFPLQNFVAYNILWRKLRKTIPESKHCLLDYTLRVLLVIIPWLLAMAMPHLGPFIALFGAFCLSLLAIVFPGLMDACIWYPDRYGACRYKLLRDVFIVVVGSCCLLAGCYTSVLEIIEHAIVATASASE